ncbi:MBL fold metallo-hydrolase [Elongatibacter sediminis]|uniref:MBL fold metallo-hydrolase n=1 Tax=Elongatibacter sediminis TaxID=3119006 RepID=A0AAW9RGA5_9GAMM
MYASSDPIHSGPAPLGRACRFIALAVFIVTSPLAGDIAADEAQRLIDAALTAHGGRARLERIESIAFELAGYRISRHQSRRTEPPWDRIPVRGFTAIDLKQGWSVRDGVGSYPGGLVFPYRSIIGPEGEWTLDTGQRTRFGGMVMAGADAVQGYATTMMTPLLVTELADRRDSLELAEATELFGTRYPTVTDGETDVLFHPVTHRVHATRTRRWDMTRAGSIDMFRIYPEYRQHEGIAFPAAIFEYLPDEPAFTADFRLTRLSLNPDITPWLNLPGDFADAVNNPHIGYGNPGGIQTREIADGVWLAGDHGTNVLYVEFDDYFVAMEAGGMPGYVKDVYEAMRPHMKDKPLRYIVPTHYHDDHAVGLRFYTRIGATVLTTPGKAGYLRELVGAVDDGALLDELRFEWITGQGHRFEDDTGVLDVRVYADAPHTENLLVGWLPRAAAVFTADIFVGWGTTPQIRQGGGFGLRHYAAWLERTVEGGLDGIDWHLPAHGRPYSANEIAAMLSRPRTFVTLPAGEVVNADDWFQAYGLHDETLSGRRNTWKPFD